MNNLRKLVTEMHNPKTMELDQMSVEEILTLMNEENLLLPQAIEKVLPEVKATVQVVCDSFSRGGRLFYVGAGTSGRIGLLDAVECPPTFSTKADLVQAVLAGGNSAVMTAVEGAEDDELLGGEDLKKRKLTAEDVVIGIAASGRTPYVKGALQYARSIGAASISLTSNLDSEISQHADIRIEVITGPEVLTGSTRLKAASAHKMVLNMISTVSMVKMGKAYKNLMVDVKASNYKLRERAIKIVQEATGVDYHTAGKVLHETGNAVKPAIVMLLTDVNSSEATNLLERANGFVREAIQKNEMIN